MIPQEADQTYIEYGFPVTSRVLFTLIMYQKERVMSGVCREPGQGTSIFSLNLVANVEHFPSVHKTIQNKAANA